MMGMGEWTLTDHARQRRREMGLTERQILDVLSYPELDYPGSSLYPAGRRVRVSGPLGVIFEEDSKEIVTLIWHTREERSQGPNIEGRILDAVSGGA